MTQQHNVYQDPLVSRYTDPAVQRIFSDDFKFSTWRRCWIALAETQMELGLVQITPGMIAEMKAAQYTIVYAVAAAEEKRVRHDVMAHVYEFGTHCPTAKGIIHLGATSQYVGCNTDLIQQREAMVIIKRDIVNVIDVLSQFMERYKGLVTLGYTHYQPAQPTTVGRRTAMYLQDLLYDLSVLEHAEGLMKARGAKGAVGTRASFLELFNGDVQKVEELDRRVSQKLGFDRTFTITSQTYTRKLDTIIAKALGGIGESAHKFAVDLRLLANLKVMEEPSEENQTGSSAMAYKRNPMRSERMTGLSEKLMNLPIDFAHIHANQWFERTLDDSAIRRMDIPQAFLLANAVLKLYHNITKGIVVFPAQIKRHLADELPFMATEVILMELCKSGADRQEMHEKLKVHSLAAGKRVKEEGKSNDLFERLASDPTLPIRREFLDGLLEDPSRFAGDAQYQTERFLEEEVNPVLEKYGHLVGTSSSEIKV